MKKLIAMLCVLVLCAGMLTACGGQGGENTEGPAGYSVQIVDALGAPYGSGIIVRFMQDGQQVSMQKIGEDGTAVNDLPDGTYTVELQFTDTAAAYHYSTDGLTLTAENKSCTVVLSKTVSGEGTPLYTPDGDTLAPDVTAGCTYVELTPGERNYFLFTPTAAGKYAFSLPEGSGAVSLCGEPHFVQSLNTAEQVEDGISYTNIKSGMISTGGTGTVILVIGIDADEGQDSAILAIERVGDTDWDIADEPWQSYQATITPAAYTLPAGAQLENFDLTAASDAYELVLGSDNYYHLGAADGPLVLVRLGEKAQGIQYTDTYETILQNIDVGRVVYDDDGNFVKKEGFSDCLRQYLAVMDAANGVYPLTEDLRYIIYNAGDYAGWYDMEKTGYYLFADADGNPTPGINKDIAWLFMCCYIKQ